ncbi:MAG: ThiF family adenylyltransferase [Phycisphaerae bacterium]|nr:ThiF family adenylyltransferase [Phycisphaerae bacterium]
MSRPPEQLVVARRYVDAVPEFSLAADLRQIANQGVWAFAVDARIRVPRASLLPKQSRWWIATTTAYPWGMLDAHPDVTEGIKCTFPHQSCNLPPSKHDIPWRQGLVCVRTPSTVFCRSHLGNDPLGKPDRMLWFLGRLLGWLHAASKNELIRDGDPFELPDFAPEDPTFVWGESAETMGIWNSVNCRYGIVELCHLSGRNENDSVIAARAFKDASGEDIVRPDWGERVLDAKVLPDAMWIRLSEVPTIEPYQAPITWGDLRVVFRQQRLAFDGIMRRALKPMRDGRRHWGLVGFPIPEVFGGEAKLMHWQAAELPELAFGTITQPGFRTNSIGYWRKDCHESFHREHRIKWCISRNWDQRQLAGRGAMSELAQNLSWTIIGVGAVGSILAECLTRTGIRRMTIVDPDTLEGGNLVRHSLSFNEVGRNKAKVMADRLRSISAHIKVTAIAKPFPVTKAQDQKVLQESDVLVDCTGSDEVFGAMSEPPWNQDGLQISVSLGYGAQCCYLYFAPAHRFDLIRFQTAAEKWLKRDAKLIASADLPTEAIGCWHPLFPARCDHIYSLVGMAVDEIERWVKSDSNKEVLVVFERKVELQDGVAVQRTVVHDF